MFEHDQEGEANGQSPASHGSHSRHDVASTAGLAAPAFGADVAAALVRCCALLSMAVAIG